MNHNIFALELCLRLERDDRLREELRGLVVNHPAATSPGRKWGMLKRAVELLLSGEDRFEKGCWDFFEDDAKSLTDYEMWSQGMITEEGARREPSGPPGDGDARYMTFTISLLLQAGSDSAEALGRLCNVPQPDLWKRETFLRILAGLSCVSFAAVKSDVLYLIPGDESWGLTAQDLTDPKFHYLRPIE